MNLKNIIILGELDYVLAASFNAPQNKAKCLAYDADLLDMERNEDGATNINCLYVLKYVSIRLVEYVLLSEPSLFITYLFSFFVIY